MNDLGVIQVYVNILIFLTAYVLYITYNELRQYTVER